MENKLVVIRQFDTPENAHIAKIDLENAGIYAVVENDVLPSIGLFYTMPTCSVKLLVRETDADQARELLQDIDTNPAIDENGNPIFRDEDLDEIEPD